MESFEIHHIDGNWKNNDPSNLIALSILDHYNIHYQQEDYRACTLIGKKMGISSEQISILASLSAKKQVEKGIHNFLGGKIQSESNRRRVEAGTHHLLGGNQQRMVTQRRLRDGTHHFLTNHPNKKVVECPYCLKSGGAMIMRRWHFDNCKSK